VELNLSSGASRLLPAWPGWRRLPREARDTLFLLGVIAWTVLPHVPRLPLWCSVFAGVVLLWRARLAVVNAPLPSRRLVVLVLVLVGLLTLWSHRTLLGKEAGITMVVAMMALKTLELRARRDAFVVFFLGFFVVLTQFLNSQSMLVAAAMVVSIWGLLTALVLAHMPVGQPAIAQAGALAARAALLGAPVMALLFVLFPRIGPLWGVPQDASAKTGLSNSMSLGAVAELAKDDSVALRLKFEGTPPPLSAMYLRGPVLANFDGRDWKRSESSGTRGSRPQAEPRLSGPALRYEMTLEPLRLTTLPLLEMSPASQELAPRIEGFNVVRRDDGQWVTDRPIAERLRFSAQAQLTFQHGPRSYVPALQEFLALPPGFNPRTLAWAQRMRADERHANADARELAQALLAHIRQGGFSYTLEPGTYGRDAIDEFWLDRKLGFCEHFAASFVVVMRAMGVPARVVTGYQGADPTLVDGYMIVRNSYAHAWAEYWQSGIGWVRIDPTAAVAPDRIGASRSLAPPPGLVAGALSAMSPTLLAHLRDGWEALNNRWNQWVLSYSRGQQLDLLKRLGVSSPSWEDLAYLLIGALSGLSILGAAWAWWDRNRQEPWARLQSQVQRALQGLGIEAGAHDPPRRLAQAVRQRLGDAGQPLAALLETLELQRYGRNALRHPSAAWMHQFRNELRSATTHRGTR
jgi:protein-glutamine gamma-glutamyltransferase